MKRPKTSSITTTALALSFLLVFGGAVLGADFERQTLELKLGGSDIVQTAHLIKRVSIADPDIADVVVLSPREMYVFGKKVGYTSVIMWAEGKGQKTLLDVVVSLDLTALKEKIFELYPSQKIEVHGTETGIVLAGTVSGPEVVEQVLRLAHSFLPIEGEGGRRGATGGTGKSALGVTNLLKVGGIQQVMLEVKFAEVRRNSTKDWQAALGLEKLGKDFIGAASGAGGVLTPGLTGDILNTVNFGAAGQQTFGQVLGDAGLDGLIQNPRSLLLNFAGNDPNIFVKVDNLTAALKFLETEGLARTLAEPRLVAMSGQEASFLAGGEFPVQTTGGLGDVEVEFKEFGVGLVFTPVVLSDGTISLRVQPSVSELSSITETDSAFLPQFVTRKLDTTVHLQDGQTLALAGLLQDSMRESVSKIPFLGDIPILGAFFRSTAYQQEKTDLLISVTPHLVTPIQKEDLRYPGEDFNVPNWFEFYLEGRLEGRPDPEPEMQSAEAPAPATAQTAIQPVDGGGLEGSFGHGIGTPR